MMAFVVIKRLRLSWIVLGGDLGNRWIQLSLVAYGGREGSLYQNSKNVCAVLGMH